MDYNTLPTTERIQKTLEAVRRRGIKAELVETKKAALARVRALIPAGVTIMTGASITLQQIGLEDLLIGKKHSWRNLKDEILEEKDPLKQTLLRKQGTLADWYLGSVHAIAETGEIVVASATGSQLPAIAFTGSNVILVVGAQKITATLTDAVTRVRTYVLPLEDRHMKELYGEKVGSMIGKMLIFERESPFVPRNLHLVLVNEVLGF
jgi:L-lactate utilization protein LutC